MKIFVVTVFCFVFAMVLPVFAAPMFSNSVVSNDLEFITQDDESAYSCLGYTGEIRAEMPDKRNDELFADGVFSYISKFSDGTRVSLWVHPDIGTNDAAEPIATVIAKAIGKLPTIMRRKLDHVVILVGDETAFAEDLGHFFVLYTENIETRIENHDLEETVFHESVHATLDSKYGQSAEWQSAQKADGAFVTKYAANNPQKEDMAESALFAWATLRHPKRLPIDIEKYVTKTMPNRLEFFEGILMISLFSIRLENRPIVNWFEL